MRSTHDVMNDQETNEAAWEAMRGSGYGALKYGAATAVLHGVGVAMSPLYRGLTIQFKVYLWMCAITTGSMFEADHRIKMYEARIRQERRIQRHEARLRALELEMQEED